MDVLLNAKTTNGAGTDLIVRDGGFKLLRIYGTFDGATVTLSIDFNGSTTFVTDSAYTAQGVYYVNSKVGLTYRATISGAGAGTSLSAEML